MTEELEEEASVLRRLAAGLVPDSVERAQHLTEETAVRLIHAFEQSQPIRRLRGSEVATAFLGAVGFALFLVGVERAAEDIPLLSNPYGSILVGLAILAAAGVLIRRLTGGE
jgi:hypothetical protein